MEYYNLDSSCYNQPINAFNANGRIDAINNNGNTYNIKKSIEEARTSMQQISAMTKEENNQKAKKNE